MSQINDALKRAKQAQRRNAPSASSAAPPLRPFEAKNVEQGPNWIWPVAIILFFLLFAGVFFAISAGSHATTQMAAAPAAIQTRVQTVEVSATNFSKPLPVAMDLAVLKTAKPARIQGIVYDSVNPLAIIGGKTIHVGDAVDGMVVTGISRDAITLVGNGQTRQLHVGEK
jgi:hypothetical protein